VPFRRKDRSGIHYAEAHGEQGQEPEQDVDPAVNVVKDRQQPQVFEILVRWRGAGHGGSLLAEGPLLTVRVSPNIDPRFSALHRRLASLSPTYRTSGFQSVRSNALVAL
jgi:hypothetical protein